MQNRFGIGYAWATRGGVGTCIRVKQGLSVGRLSGWVAGESVGCVTWLADYRKDLQMTRS